MHTEGITLNLLTELGISGEHNARKIKNAHTLTLYPELGIVSSYTKPHTRHFDTTAIPGDVTYMETFNVKDTRKIRYYMGWTGVSVPSHVEFSVEVHSKAASQLTISPMWLVIPKFQEFLKEHLPKNIRNDFNPDKNWMPRISGLMMKGSSTTKKEFYEKGKEFMSVISPEGMIKWDWETHVATIDGIYEKNPQRRRFSKDARSIENFYTNTNGVLHKI